MLKTNCWIMQLEWSLKLCVFQIENQHKKYRKKKRILRDCRDQKKKTNSRINCIEQNSQLSKYPPKCSAVTFVDRRFRQVDWFSASGASHSWLYIGCTAIPGCNTISTPFLSDQTLENRAFPLPLLLVRPMLRSAVFYSLRRIFATKTFAWPRDKTDRFTILWVSTSFRLCNAMWKN